MDNNLLSFFFGIVTFLVFQFCILFGYTFTLLLSTLIASIWLFWFYYDINWIYNGIPVEAEVVELVCSAGNSKPRVIFTTHDRQEISYTPRWANTFPGIRVGDKVYVVYQPDNPHQAMILKFRFSFCMSWGFTCLAIAVAAFCVGALIGQKWLIHIVQSAGTV